jgi:hypothetical protein
LPLLLVIFQFGVMVVLLLFAIAVLFDFHICVSYTFRPLLTLLAMSLYFVRLSYLNNKVDLYPHNLDLIMRAETPVSDIKTL